MKKLKQLSATITFFLITIKFISAQTPQGLNYQALARDAGGSILPSKNIGIQISITNGSGGTLLYRERFFPTTNQFGLFTLNIGSGSIIFGTFSSITWAT